MRVMEVFAIRRRGARATCPGSPAGTLCRSVHRDFSQSNGASLSQRGAAIGAAAGGLGGAATGGGYKYTKSKEGYEKAFAACMTGRGYSVAR